jgi:hypothetical protein
LPSICKTIPNSGLVKSETRLKREKIAEFTGDGCVAAHVSRAGRDEENVARARGANDDAVITDEQNDLQKLILQLEEQFDRYLCAVDFDHCELNKYKRLFTDANEPTRTFPERFSSVHGVFGQCRESGPPRLPKLLHPSMLTLHVATQYQGGAGRTSILPLRTTGKGLVVEMICPSRRNELDDISSPSVILTMDGSKSKHGA